MLPTTISDADPEDIRHSRATSVSTVRMHSPTRKRSPPHQHQDAILIDFDAEEDLVDLSLPTTPNHVPQPTVTVTSVGYPLVQVQPDRDLLEFRAPSRIPSHANLVDLSDPLGAIPVPVPTHVSPSQHQHQPKPEPEPTHIPELPLPLPTNPFLSPDDPPESPIDISLSSRPDLPRPHPILAINANVKGKGGGGEEDPFEDVEVSPSGFEDAGVSRDVHSSPSPSRSRSRMEGPIGSPFDHISKDTDTEEDGISGEWSRRGKGKEWMAQEIDRIVGFARGRVGERRVMGEWTDMQQGMEVEMVGGHDSWAVPAFRDELGLVDVGVGVDEKVERRVVEMGDGEVEVEESLKVQGPPEMEEPLKVQESSVMEEPLKEDEPSVQKIEEVVEEKIEEQNDATLVHNLEVDSVNVEEEMKVEEPMQKIDVQELVQVGNEEMEMEEEMDATLVEEHVVEMEEVKEEPLVRMIQELPDMQQSQTVPLPSPLVDMEEQGQEPSQEPTHVQESTSTSTPIPMLPISVPVPVPEVHSPAATEDIDTLLAITPSASINDSRDALELEVPPHSNSGEY